jgi:hypothetical protein
LFFIPITRPKLFGALRNRGSALLPLSQLVEKGKSIVDIIEFADTKRPMEKQVLQAAERRKRIFFRPGLIVDAASRRVKPCPRVRKENEARAYILSPLQGSFASDSMPGVRVAHPWLFSCAALRLILNRYYSKFGQVRLPLPACVT